LSTDDFDMIYIRI